MSDRTTAINDFMGASPGTALLPPRPAVIVVCDSPMQAFIEAHQVRAAREGETLADSKPGKPGAWMCYVDTNVIPKSAWHYMPRPGSVVQWRRVAAGGGGEDNSGSRAVLNIIALIVITIVTEGMGTGWYATLTRVGLQLAATALINNLVPLGQQGGPSQSYNARTQNNVPRLGQPIPEYFGFANTFPDLGAQPYNTWTRTEQTLHLVLCLGEGQHHICRVSNGDTDLRNYDDVTIVRVGPGQSTQDGPGTGVETLGEQTLVDPRWVTSQDANLVEMRPGQPAGPFTVCPRETVVDKIRVDLVQPRGMSREVRMRWRVEAQEIDDFEQPLSIWRTIGTHTTTRESSSPQYFPQEYLMAKPARYWVRMVRTDEIGRELEDIDQLSVLALMGHVTDGDINVEGCTFICIQVRVTGQINGGLRFRVMSYRMLEVWDGSTWLAPAITRNPAWVFTQILRSRGYNAASRIDLTQALALAPVWESRYDSFDHCFDTQVSVYDALSTVLRVGRAFPIARAGRWTVVRDGPATLPVAGYGMRNIVRGSMTMKPALAQSDQMRTLDLEYQDYRHNSLVTVTAQIHNRVVYGYRGDAQRVALGLPEPDQNRRGRVEVPGIIGENHALRTVVYTLADRYYRSVDVEIDVELEGHMPALLALVSYQHDVGNFGQTGDTVSWNGDDLILEASEPLRWEAGSSHAVRLQYPSGALTPAIAVTPGDDDYTAVLASAPPPLPDSDPVLAFEFITADPKRDRTRWYFGPQAGVGAYARVREIAPKDERRVGLKLVLEDDRVHNVDAQWIAPDPLPPCEVEEVVGGPLLLFNGQGFTPSDFPIGSLAGAVEGDLIVVFLMSHTAETFPFGESVIPLAPAGWTLHTSGVESAFGTAIAFYSSYYSPSNAEVTRENFPYSSPSAFGGGWPGGYVAICYPGGTLRQVSDMAVTGYGGSVINIPAMDLGAEASSDVFAIAAARSNASETVGPWAAAGMEELPNSGFGFVYFIGHVFQQTDFPQATAKIVNKPAGPYTSFGVQFEVAYS